MRRITVLSIFIGSLFALGLCAGPGRCGWIGYAGDSDFSLSVGSASSPQSPANRDFDDVPPNDQAYRETFQNNGITAIANGGFGGFLGGGAFDLDWLGHLTVAGAATDLAHQSVQFTMEGQAISAAYFDASTRFTASTSVILTGTIAPGDCVEVIVTGTVEEFTLGGVYYPLYGATLDETLDQSGSFILPLLKGPDSLAPIQYGFDVLNSVSLQVIVNRGNTTGEQTTINLDPGQDVEGSPSPAPEPTGLMLLSVGVCALAGYGCRHRRRKASA